MAGKVIIWLLILGCVVLTTIAAPSSSEESAESSEESTTIGVSTLPGKLPTAAENSEITKPKRQTEEQVTKKPEADSESNQFLTKPQPVDSPVAGVLAERVARNVPEEDKPVPEPLPPKPEESTFEIKKDGSQPVEKRQTEQNQGDLQKPTSSESDPVSKPEVVSPLVLSNLPATQPVRNGEEAGQSEKNPRLSDSQVTSATTAQGKEEQREKRETGSTETDNKPVLQRPLSTIIPEETQTRTKRAAAAQNFNRPQPQPPRPQPPRPQPPNRGPQNNRPGFGPQNNRPGQGPQNNRPGPGRRP